MLVSIITPTLNEAEQLPRRALELSRLDGPWEWIVADGASSDCTCVAARRFGARVVHAGRGRGTQLNAGADAAEGDVYLFLHADTKLRPGSLKALRDAVKAGVIGGNFDLEFEGGALSSGLFTGYYWLQRRLLGIYYGDSAIFVRADVFEDLEGFPDYPIMEDLEFVQKLEAAGETCCLPVSASTSSRRYDGRVMRTVFTWLGMFTLYKAGVPPEHLDRFYPAIR